MLIASELSGGVARTAERHAPLLMSVGEAMRALSVGRTKLYDLIAAGEIELVKIGSKSCIVVDSAAAYVERLRAAAQCRKAA
jgi:excisionase family DNA binding protein